MAEIELRIRSFTAHFCDCRERLCSCPFLLLTVHLCSTIVHRIRQSCDYCSVSKNTPNPLFVFSFMYSVTPVTFYTTLHPRPSSIPATLNLLPPFPGTTHAKIITSSMTKISETSRSVGTILSHARAPQPLLSLTPSPFGPHAQCPSRRTIV